MNMKLKTTPMVLFKFLLLIGILVSFYYFIPFTDIIHSILKTNLILFILSVFISFPAFYLTTVSTWILAKRQGIDIPLNDFYIFNLSTRFYGFFSPLSTIATGMRWQKLSASKKYAEALSAITFTRFFSIVSAVVSGLFWALFRVNQDWKILPWFIGLIYILFIGWNVITRFSPNIGLFIEKQQSDNWHPVFNKILGFSKKYIDSIQVYSAMPIKVLSTVILLNFSNDLLGLLAHVLLAQALNIPLTLYDLGWVRSISFLLSVIPVTLPGGIGVREVTLVVLLSALKVPPDVSAAYSLLIYSRGVIISLLCGIFAIGTITRD